MVTTVKKKILATALGASVVIGATAAIAQPAPMPLMAPQSAGLPTAGAVSAVYDKYKIKPLWFRNGTPTVAATQLVQILQRSPVDGLTSGPQLAAQIQAAMQATAGNPAAVAQAEQLMSSAWVMYVQTIKRPTNGMIYAYDILKPHGTRADQILLTAAAAPSLESHVSSLAAVNPIYAGIRDAEWARMQASNSLAPDPRVLANLDRVRSIPATGRYILVDSASQRMFMYDNGALVDSMKVVVGMPTMPTPLIASIMYYVTFNPQWNAPVHLVKGPIATKTLAGGMKYFQDHMGYEVMADWSPNAAVVPAESIDWKAVSTGKIPPPRVRQKPGKENFMGVLKFTFPNSQDIYLHDTPAKNKFAEADRADSNGCVRVEDAHRFARWLLGREPVAPGSDPEIPVQMPRGVPIYLTYITAQPSNGQLTYLRDVYGWDRPGAQIASSYVSPVAAAR